MSDPLHSHAITDVKTSALLNGDSELRDSTTLGSTSLAVRGGRVFLSPGATQRVACWKALARGEGSCQARVAQHVAHSRYALFPHCLAC